MNRKPETSCNVLDGHGGFLWMERRATGHIRRCHQCKRDMPSFRVPALLSRKLKKLEFCLECLTLVYKPGHYGGDPGLKVEIRDKNGDVVGQSTYDYCDRPPQMMRHIDCPTGDSFMKLISEEDKNEVVRMRVFECRCGRERYVKYYKENTCVQLEDSDTKLTTPSMQTNGSSIQ